MGKTGHPIRVRARAWFTEAYVARDDKRCQLAWPAPTLSISNRIQRLVEVTLGEEVSVEIVG